MDGHSHEEIQVGYKYICKLKKYPTERKLPDFEFISSLYMQMRFIP